MARSKSLNRIDAPMESAESRRWQAQDALRTLTRANEIRGDSRLMAEVKREAQRVTKAVGLGVAGPSPSGRKR